MISGALGGITTIGRTPLEAETVLLSRIGHTTLRVSAGSILDFRFWIGRRFRNGAPLFLYLGSGTGRKVGFGGGGGFICEFFAGDFGEGGGGDETFFYGV